MFRFLSYAVVVWVVFSFTSESFAKGKKVIKKSGIRLKVSVTKVKNAKGKVWIALFRKAKGFPDGRHARYQLKVKARVGKVFVTFKGLAPGQYAVSVYHDANKNKKFDTNFFGIPKEGYGFSKNAKSTFGAPSFSKASFLIGVSDLSISLKMRY